MKRVKLNPTTGDAVLDQNGDAVVEDAPESKPVVDSSASDGIPKRIESSIFPNAANVPGNGLVPSAKRIGLGVLDVLNTPTRAAATLRGQSMSEPNAYFLRPETEKAKAKAEADLNKHPEINDWIPPGGFGGMPMMMPTPAMGPGLTEMGGQGMSDPTMFVGPLTRFVSGAARAGGRAILGQIPKLKNYVSGLSRIDAPLLEKAATTSGINELVEGAKTPPSDVGQQIANDAGRVNKYREELAANSKKTQQDQIQIENDRAELETKQVNADLANKAEGQTLYQQELAANSKKTQQQQTEEMLLDARRRATGADATSMSEIKPGALGEDIKSSVMGGKADMQDAWVKADQASVGPLRAAKAPEITKGFAGKPMKVLTARLGDVMEKYKAYDPSEGMRRISEGGASVLRDLMEHSNVSGHTVDDLLNIKAELRRARNLDKYKGIPFDLSVDEVAFGDADREISGVIDQALKEAAPKEAGAISELMKAKDRQYAITKDLLGDQARSVGQTQNTVNIISKVRSMGPAKARELIAGAESNPAIAGLVPKLRQAFVDDLILSSMKNGEFSAETMAKSWNAPGMQEMKAAWLGAEDLKRVDNALGLGTAEMGRPAAVRAMKVPYPAKLGSPSDRSQGFYSQLARQEISAPPKVGESFSFGGKSDPITAEARVKNIGNEKDINKRAMMDLKVLDKLNGTKYAEQAQKVYESIQLGMDANGALAQHPLQTTGARGYAGQKGKIIGGALGGLIGVMLDHGFGAMGGGSAAGAVVGDVVANMHANLGSPAGAVAAYRKMNQIMETKFPKSAAIARTLESTTEPVARARLLVILENQLAKEENGSKDTTSAPMRARLGSALYPRIGESQ